MVLNRYRISRIIVNIPASGEPILITESPAIRLDEVSVQDVRLANGFVPDKVAATLKELGLSNCRAGLVAGPWLVISIYNRLLSAAMVIE